jgi:hypothetical protein
MTPHRPTHHRPPPRHLSDNDYGDPAQEAFALASLNAAGLPGDQVPFGGRQLLWEALEAATVETGDAELDAENTEYFLILADYLLMEQYFCQVKLTPADNHNRPGWRPNPLYSTRRHVVLFSPFITGYGSVPGNVYSKCTPLGVVHSTKEPRLYRTPTNFAFNQLADAVERAEGCEKSQGDLEDELLSLQTGGCLAEREENMVLYGSVTRPREFYQQLTDAQGVSYSPFEWERIYDVITTSEGRSAAVGGVYREPVVFIEHMEAEDFLYRKSYAGEMLYTDKRRFKRWGSALSNAFQDSKVQNLLLIMPTRDVRMANKKIPYWGDVLEAIGWRLSADSDFLPMGSLPPPPKATPRGAVDYDEIMAPAFGFAYLKSLFVKSHTDEVLGL